MKVAVVGGRDRRIHCPAAGPGWSESDLAHREPADKRSIRAFLVLVELSWHVERALPSAPDGRHRPLPHLSAQQPGVRWLRFAGGLAWYAVEELHRYHDHHVAHGYDSQLLSRDQISAHTPGVNAAAIPHAGAMWNPGEGWVDLPSLVQFLIKDFWSTAGS